MDIDIETAIGIGLIAVGLTSYAYWRLKGKTSKEALAEAKETIDDITDIVEDAEKDAKEIIDTVEDVTKETKSIIDTIKENTQ